MVRSLELPFVFKNQLLLSPGNWNGLDVRSNSIEMSLQNTKWNSKNSSLIYSHAKEAEKWVGNVLNPKLVSGSLYGDLEIWDRDLGVKLKYGKAPLGISARFGYMEQEPNTPVDMFYENFSVVYDPACKPAMINFNKKESPDGILHTEVICNDAIQTVELENEVTTKTSEGKEIDAHKNQEIKKEELSNLISNERRLSSKNTMGKEEEKVDKADESKEETEEKSEVESKEEPKNAELSALKEKVESISARVAELEEEDKEDSKEETEDDKSEEESKEETKEKVEEKEEIESKEESKDEKVSELTEAATALKEASPKTTAEFGLDNINSYESTTDRLVKELGC